MPKRRVHIKAPNAVEETVEEIVEEKEEAKEEPKKKKGFFGRLFG